MILRHTVTIQTKTLTASDEGIQAPTWVTFKTIAADVQPANLSKVEAQMFGITDRAANTKKMFYYFDASITETMRAIWDGKTYDILGCNEWNIHGVSLLVPVVL